MVGVTEPERPGRVVADHPRAPSNSVTPYRVSRLWRAPTRVALSDSGASWESDRAQQDKFAHCRGEGWVKIAPLWHKPDALTAGETYRFFKRYFVPLPRVADGGGNRSEQRHAQPPAALPGKALRTK